MNIKVLLDNYRKSEVVGLGYLSADHVRAAYPLTFLMHGYPTRIQNRLDILKYVDTMQELSDLNYFLNQLFVSDEEKLRIQNFEKIVGSATLNSLKVRVDPWIGPLATLPVARAVQVLSKIKNRRTLNILEIGSGSGYLTAHLANMGHRIWATDITEGFYLWQSLFWKSLCKYNFFEGQNLRPFQTLSHIDHMLVHIPWWVFFSCYASELPLFDVVICDHAFGEMYPYGYKYVVSMIRKLSLLNQEVCVLYESFGEPRYQSPEHLASDLASFGFTQVKVDPFTLHCKKKGELDSNSNKNEFRNCKFVGPRESFYTCGRNCLSFDDRFAPKSIEFYKFLGYRMPPDI